MHIRPNNIPDTATIAFSGVQFRIWQWPQTEFDGEVKTYEIAERCPTLWVIAVVGDKILLHNEIHSVRPDHPFYSLPGGKSNFDEDSLEGTKRELSEESGYESSDWVLWYQQIDTMAIYWPTFIYIARNASQTHAPHPDGGEKITPLLVSVEEFFQYVEREDFRGHIVKNMVAEMRKNPEKKADFIKALGI